MSYVGNTPTQQAFTPQVDFFNGNGSTVAFTLSRPVASVAQVQAVISNVPQNPGSAYTVSGNTITFTSAPPSGTSNIYVYYTSPITQVIAPGQGTVTTTALMDGSVTPAKLSTGAPTWNTSGNIAGANATIGTNNLTLRAAANNYVEGALALQDAAGTSKNYITPIAGTIYFGDNSANSCATMNQYGIGLGGNAASSGLGIKFPATQSASSDANTLDDYEEGSFTPSISGTGMTYNQQLGRYTKIGNLVCVQLNLYLSGGTVTIPNTVVNNLPFACADVNNASYGMGVKVYNSNGGITYGAGKTELSSYVQKGATYIVMETQGSAVSSSAPSAISNTASIYIFAQYIAAA